MKLFDAECWFQCNCFILLISFLPLSSSLPMFVCLVSVSFYVMFLFCFSVIKFYQQPWCFLVPCFNKYVQAYRTTYSIVKEPGALWKLLDSWPVTWKQIQIFYSLVLKLLNSTFATFQTVRRQLGYRNHRLLDSLVVSRVLASSAGCPRFNPQSRTASYQRRYKNGTSSSLVWHSTLKREILALSQELR